MIDIETLEFAELKEENIPDLLAIYNYYVLNTTATFHEKPLALSEFRELVVFADSKYATYVIKDAGKICGYILLTQFKKREAYDRTGEITIYLKNGSSGKGIGKAALSYVERKAREQGFHTLMATICGENERSIYLFVRNGYKKCAHLQEVGRKFGRWLDIVVYQKLL